MEWGEHMFKKVLLISILTVFCISLGGCTQVTDLSEDETRLIAEYAADLLLSHDRGYDDRLQEGETESGESADTRETSDMMATTETTENESTDVSTQTGTDQPVVTESAMDDIAQIAGISGASVRYRDYEVVKQYPDAGEGENAVQIDAPDGYELLVLHFVINATQDQPVEVSLIDDNIEYELVCNGSMAANPMLTILTNDLTTLEATTSPGQETEAVLVFQISDTAAQQLDTMELRVTYNNIRNIITIL